jgi:Uma2 family endonuclease
MAHAPAGTRYTSDEYLALVDDGVLGPDDRVELLEGVIVAMAPEGTRHEVAVDLTAEALRAAVGGRAAVRTGHSLHVGRRSVPEPDVAVVPGRLRDYTTVRPTTALLVVEVSDTSLVSDRLSKARIYAAAGIPEYWIVNLRNETVEVFRGPEREVACYVETRVVELGGEIDLVAFPGTHVAVADLLPEE